LGYGINNAGQIVGVSTVVEGIPEPWEAYLYSNGRMNVIGGAQAGYFTPWAINDNGWITGTITSSPTNFFPPEDIANQSPFGQAVLYVNGRILSLGTLAGFTGSSQGISINNSGTIVGNLSGFIANEFAGAFVYSGGRMYNLNDLVERGWNILSVGHINDAGQIAATGTRPGSTVTYALLVTPYLGLLK
jgi:probable HAF family extracellular repeat protein